MKQLVLFFTALVLGTTGTLAVTTENNVATSSAYRFNNSFIFVEGGITFSVYPDGEFDFFIDNRVNVGANVNIGRTNITFNSGFNYSPFVQYDDFGAVIQVENIPVFYDHFGRVAQIGDIFVNYRNGFVHRLGGMNVFYNNGLYAYHTGFINPFNRRYVFRPFHRFFVRPAIGFCLVNPRPYRRFYNPVRYTWYRPYRNNVRRAYAQIGREHRYNRIRNERARVYRNDRRVAVRQNAVRRSNAVRSDRGLAGRNNTVARTDRNTVQRNNVARNTNRNTVGRDANVRSNASNRTAVTRSRATQSRTTRGTEARVSNQRTVKRSNAVSAPKRSAVRQNTVTRTPRSSSDSYRKVTRSTKTYKSPQRATSNRSVQRTTPTRSRSANVTSRTTTRKTTVSRTPSRSSKSSATRTQSRSARR
ncbi:MAG: hypothetical protein AAFX53_13690 [Bacteroidota bacterium]